MNVSYRTHNIYNYSYGTKQLTEQYVSNMNEHSKDMTEYIWTHPREYKLVKIWRDTGTYSGGRWESAIYHKESKQYQAYGNDVYTTFVPGAANQSYNPYTGTGGKTSNNEGASGANSLET